MIYFIFNKYIFSHFFLMGSFWFFGTVPLRDLNQQQQMPLPLRVRKMLYKIRATTANNNKSIIENRCQNISLLIGFILTHCGMLCHFVQIKNAYWGKWQSATEKTALYNEGR